MSNLILRQGDVLIVAVTKIPKSTVVKRDARKCAILAEGEVTGHAHRIPSRHAVLYRTESDARYMRVTAPVALEHEEHTTVQIPVGLYSVRIHREYEPGALSRQVAD